MRFVPDQIEALIALGRLEEAEPLLDVLERQAAQLDRASALAAAAAAAVSSRPRAAISTVRSRRSRSALVGPRACVDAVRAARTLLVLGATRRRARMKRPARESLEDALEIFEQLGARLWAEKARAELARVGGRPPPPAS